MRTALKISALLFILAALAMVATPALASTGSFVCVVSPGSGPVGTTFGIACSGFTPGRISNVYAVEPDGRASGLNIYGFFPTSVKADSGGVVSFRFVTEVAPFFSVPPGTYIFVVQELVPDGGGAVKVRAQVPVNVESSPRPLLGAVLTNSFVGSDASTGAMTYAFAGTGWDPFEAVNTWVTQPPGTQCSGLGIDQLTLGALGTGSSSLWSGPGTVKADAAGAINFTILFRSSACRGDYTVSAKALGSGIGAETALSLGGFSIPATNAVVSVSPDMVPAFHSFHVVSGSGFPANTGVSCWYTRPDGRVLGFIDVNAKTDGSGSFSVGNTLDDFPPFTSTEPGTWHVTCATTSRSAIGEAAFTVFALMTDP